MQVIYTYKQSYLSSGCKWHLIYPLAANNVHPGTKNDYLWKENDNYALTENYYPLTTNDIYLLAANEVYALATNDIYHWLQMISIH